MTWEHNGNTWKAHRSVSLKMPTDGIHLQDFSGALPISPLLPICNKVNSFALMYHPIVRLP